MSLFKKSTPVTAPDPILTYPVEVVFWKDHYTSLSELFKAAEIDLNEMRGSGYLNCKLVPEPDNENDPDAVKVYAAVKGNKKDWYDIGYITSDFNREIRPDIKKVVAGTHYWSLRWYFDVKNGLELSIKLHESQFK